MGGKTEIRLFVSYARANKNLAGRFLERYKGQVGASRSYHYVFCQDKDILVGEEWHDAIAHALEGCTLGLILISPALLGSQYVTEFELPRFIGNGAKPVIPVMLQPVDLERHDLKGLASHQIFQLESERFRSPKAYGECTGNQRDRFVRALFREVEEKLDKLFGGRCA
jgi:hypothetical protein